MSTVEEVESAVAKLSPGELCRFREWFEGFVADAWDRQWEQDARSGQLDKAGERAIEDFRSGRCTEL